MGGEGAGVGGATTAGRAHKMAPPSTFPRPPERPATPHSAAPPGPQVSLLLVDVGDVALLRLLHNHLPQACAAVSGGGRRAGRCEQSKTKPRHAAAARPPRALTLQAPQGWMAWDAPSCSRRQPPRWPHQGRPPRTGMRSGYFSLIRAASACRFSAGAAGRRELRLQRPAGRALRRARWGLPCGVLLLPARPCRPASAAITAASAARVVQAARQGRGRALSTRLGGIQRRGQRQAVSRLHGPRAPAPQCSPRGCSSLKVFWRTMEILGWRGGAEAPPGEPLGWDASKLLCTALKGGQSSTFPRARWRAGRL